MVLIVVGWIIIVIYKENKVNKAIELAAAGDFKSAQEVERNIWSSMSKKEKFFSLKAMHGLLMFIAWLQFFGRFFYLVFLGNMYGHGYFKELGGNYKFTCYTYPVYKKDVANYIFCDDEPQENNDAWKLWDECRNNKFCPVHHKNAHASPWDDDGFLGENALLKWIVLWSVIIPLLTVVIVFKFFVKNGKKETKDD